VAVGLFVVPKHVFGHVVVEFIYKPIAPNSLKLHLLDRKQLVIIVSVFVFHAVFLVRNVGEQLSCSLSRTIFKLFRKLLDPAPTRGNKNEKCARAVACLFGVQAFEI